MSKDPLRAIVLTLEVTLFCGLQNSNILSLGLVQKECRGVANVVAESYWLRQLLTELEHPPQ
jgi:hypothetical protein